MDISSMICSQCNESIVDCNGMKCDGQCQKYYHYQCLNLSKTKYKNIMFEIGEWKCYNCSFGNTKNMIEREIKDSLQYIVHKLKLLEPITSIVNNHEERLKTIEENKETLNVDEEKASTSSKGAKRKRKSKKVAVQQKNIVPKVPVNSKLNPELSCLEPQQHPSSSREVVVCEKNETQTGTKSDTFIENQILKNSIENKSIKTDAPVETPIENSISFETNLDVPCKITQNNFATNVENVSEIISKGNSFIGNCISSKNSENLCSNSCQTELELVNNSVVNKINPTLPNLQKQNVTDIESDSQKEKCDFVAPKSSQNNNVMHNIPDNNIVIIHNTAIENLEPLLANKNESIIQDEVSCDTEKKPETSEIQLEKFNKNSENNNFVENSIIFESNEELLAQKSENNVKIKLDSESSNIVSSTNQIEAKTSQIKPKVKENSSDFKTDQETQTTVIAMKSIGNQTKVKTAQKLTQTDISFINKIDIQPVEISTKKQEINIFQHELLQLKLPTNNELKTCLPSIWNRQNDKHSQNTVQFTLNGEEPECITIKKYFTDTIKNSKIEKIYRIENPHSYIMYLLKMEEVKKFYNVENIELSLFHGTKNTNIESIMKNNFNWRLCQKRKYGNGVSFARNASYALAYTDNLVNDNNFMFLSSVLAVTFCKGDGTVNIPTNLADSAISPDHNVFVKFDDHTFYPQYLIRFKKNP